MKIGKVQSIITRILVGLMGLILIALGVQALFSIDSMAPTLGLSATGVLGHSSFRAIIGALLGGIGVLQTVAAIRTNREWLFAALAMTAAIVVCRTVGIVLDGTTPEVTKAFITEGIGLAIKIWAYRVWGNAK